MNTSATHAYWNKLGWLSLDQEISSLLSVPQHQFRLQFIFSCTSIGQDVASNRIPRASAVRALFEAASRRGEVPGWTNPIVENIISAAIDARAEPLGCAEQLRDPLPFAPHPDDPMFGVQHE